MLDTPALKFTRDTDLALPNHRMAQDIFFERAPARLKDRMPRIWKADNICHIGFGGKSLFPDSQVNALGNFEGRPGASELGPRLKDMDREGVDAEFAFGNAINALMAHPDLEMRETAFRIYNEHLAELQEKAPGRFYGVGFVNYWDIDKTESSLAELKALGLKTYILPLKPGNHLDGSEVRYCSERMEPFWNAIEAAGLPVMHHIGENGLDTGRNSFATVLLQHLQPFRKMFAEYTFGGIIDRNPKLQIAWIEGGLNWVLSTIQDAAFVYASFHASRDYDMQKEVKDYWRDHMFASFMYDPLGLRLVDEIGVDKAMWSSDYPHQESTLGYGWDAMQEVMDAVSSADARKILGGNALKLFDLE